MDNNKMEYTRIMAEMFAQGVYVALIESMPDMNLPANKVDIDYFHKIFALTLIERLGKKFNVEHMKVIQTEGDEKK